MRKRYVIALLALAATVSAVWTGGENPNNSELLASLQRRILDLGGPDMPAARPLVDVGLLLIKRVYVGRQLAQALRSLESQRIHMEEPLNQALQRSWRGDLAMSEVLTLQLFPPLDMVAGLRMYLDMVERRIRELEDVNKRLRDALLAVGV